MLLETSSGKYRTPLTLPDLTQQLPVLFQPLLRDTVIGTHRFDLLPESSRVVVFPQVHQLVEDDVIPHILHAHGHGDLLSQAGFIRSTMG
jgi:hypothetical protein